VLAPDAKVTVTITTHTFLLPLQRSAASEVRSIANLVPRAWLFSLYGEIFIFIATVFGRHILVYCFDSARKALVTPDAKSAQIEKILIIRICKRNIVAYRNNNLLHEIS